MRTSKKQFVFDLALVTAINTCLLAIIITVFMSSCSATATDGEKTKKIEIHLEDETIDLIEDLKTKKIEKKLELQENILNLAEKKNV